MLLPSTSTATTESGGTSNTRIATTAFVQQELTTLIGGAPSTLNDLNELAAAINDDANYNSTLTTALATKAPIASPAFTGNGSIAGSLALNTAGSQLQLGPGNNMQIYHNGGAGEISSANDLTLDVAGDIILDADGGDIVFKDGGGDRGRINVSDNFIIKSQVSDKDIIFQGNDAGIGIITALTLDMSDAGTAIFNHGIKTGNNGYINIPTASSGNANISFDGSDFNITSNSSSADMNFQTSSQTRMTLGVGGDLTTYPLAGQNVVFNENGVDADFRVKSDTNSNMLFVDGGNNRVSIGSIGYTNNTDLNLQGKGLSLRNDKDGSNNNWSVIQNTATASGSNMYFGLATGNIEFTSGGGVTTTPAAGYHTVFNEGGIDADFRVESDANTHALFVDGGGNKVVMGSSAIPVLNGSSTRTYDLVLDKGVAIGNSPYTHGYIGTDGTDGNVVIAANSYSANLGGSRYVKIIGGTAGGGGPASIAEFNGDTGAVFNEGGLDRDFRVESDAHTHMLFVDGGNNRLGIDTSTPDYLIDVGNGTSSPTGGKVMRVNSNGDTIFSLSRAGTSLMSMRNDSTAYTCISSNNSAKLMLGYGTGDAGAINNGLLFQAGEIVVNEDSADINFRVESDGNANMLHVNAGSNTVCIGGTSAGANVIQLDAGRIMLDKSADWNIESGGSSNGLHFRVRHSNADVGSIQSSTTGTTYTTTSDRRLKKDIETITDGTDKLMAMNPVTHGWKSDPEADTVHGFIAQEMLDIVPEAVSGDPEGEDMMSMDYGRITPVIVAALQDAIKEIKELKTRINELEAK